MCHASMHYVKCHPLCSTLRLEMVMLAMQFHTQRKGEVGITQEPLSLLPISRVLHDPTHD